MDLWLPAGRRSSHKGWKVSTNVDFRCHSWSKSAALPSASVTSLSPWKAVTFVFLPDLPRLSCRLFLGASSAVGLCSERPRKTWNPYQQNSPGAAETQFIHWSSSSTLWVFRQSVSFRAPRLYYRHFEYFFRIH